MSVEIKKEIMENRVSVLGKLKEVDVFDTKTKTDVPMKIATITVETGEGELHRGKMMAVESFIDKKTQEKKENPSYKAIQTIQDEYVSMKDIAEGKASVENPTVVRMNGSLELNMYKGKDGQLKEGVQINARFVNRQDTYNEEEFGAEFTIHTYLMSNGAPVVENDEETGEVKFKAAAIDYKGQAHPFEFTATNENGIADFFENDAERGATITLAGRILNKYLVKEVEREGGTSIGSKKIVDIVRSTDRRILVEAGELIEDEDSVKFISVDLMKQANDLYEKKKTDVMSTVTEEKKEVKKGITSVGTKKTAASKADLPF